MDNNPQIQHPEQKKSPTELLAEQTTYLSALVDIQSKQKDQITELERQNEKIIESLADLVDKGDSTLDVNIENINMPFMDLVGFMVKIAIASIPAAIFIGILYAIVIAIFGGILASCT